MNLSHWQGVRRPDRITLGGRYTRLEPLDPAQHGESLFEVAQASGAEERFRYLFENPPAHLTGFLDWVEDAASTRDPLFFAVVDLRTGRAEGRQGFLRIDPSHGVIEIGHILWGPAISRTRVATEAFYLFARHVFEDLGYRRLEWKCDDLNEPSKRAALRFGFQQEGLFRQHMVRKGLNRDTAWFSIIDSDWSRLKAAYETWLAPENFDPTGQQLSRLTLPVP